MKIIRFGDMRGVGAKVERRNILGIKRTHVLRVDPDCEYFNKWICVETGSDEYASLLTSRLHRFYVAQWINREDSK